MRSWPEQPRPGRDARAVGLIGAAELALGAGVLVDPDLIGIALALHGWLAVLLVLTGARLLRRTRPSRHLLFAVLSMLALGPLGACGALWTVLQARLQARHATPFAVWHAALFPRLPVSSTRMLYERIVLRGGGPSDASSVAPFSDVMSAGTDSQKQAAISLIAENFQPRFAPPLLQALNDPEAAVRIQAATAAARIESRFLAESMRLEAVRAADPGDPVAALALARHGDAYASTGLLDAARARTAMQDALSLYVLSDRLRPGDTETGKAIGRLLLRLDRVHEAVQTLEREARLGTATPQTLAWYLEALFRLQRWDELREACRRFGEPLMACPDIAVELRQAVSFWTGQAPAGDPLR